MIRLCAICGKPIYSWDKAWSNDYGEAVHNACFAGLMYRLELNLIDPYQRIIAVGIAISMKGEKMNGAGSVIVSWDFSHDKDKDILLVGKQENGVVTVINAYQGQEARDIQKKLTVKRRKV